MVAFSIFMGLELAAVMVMLSVWMLVNAKGNCVVDKVTAPFRVISCATS